MVLRHVLVALVVSSACFSSTVLSQESQSDVNETPIIGILTQPSPASWEYLGDSYISAAYVKWVESAGGRVVPLHWNADPTELDHVLSKVNGVLFPGGDQLVNVSSLAFPRASKYIYDRVLQENREGNHLPMWFTCQGFEQLHLMVSGDDDILQPVDAEWISLPLNFESDPRDSRMFKDAPDHVIETIKSDKITDNLHEWSVYTDSYKKSRKLREFLTVISTNEDRKGTTFVSSAEARDFPFYAVQWHPERNQFEFGLFGEGVSHSRPAIRVMQYLADFFITEATRSTAHFQDWQEEQLSLIWNFDAVYLKGTDQYDVQVYFFP